MEIEFFEVQRDEASESEEGADDMNEVVEREGDSIVSSFYYSMSTTSWCIPLFLFGPFLFRSPLLLLCVLEWGAGPSLHTYTEI